MATVRLNITGADYKKELQDLETKRRKLKARVGKRLLELATLYPDVDLPTSRAGGLKCKEIAHPWIIDDLKLDYAIEYIEAIEKYMEDQHPHKQMKINF